MNIKNKKITAREFLLLLAVIVFGLLAFAGTYTFNSIKQVQIKSIENNITSEKILAYNLAKPFKQKTINGKDFIAAIEETNIEDKKDNPKIDIQDNPSDDIIVPKGLKKRSTKKILSYFNLSEKDFRNKILTDTFFKNKIYEIFITAEYNPNKNGKSNKDKKISVSDFCKKIKEKYPEYKNIEDVELANKMIEKYPQYKDKVYFNEATILNCNNELNIHNKKDLDSIIQVQPTANDIQQNKQANEILQDIENENSKITNIKASILSFNEQVSFAEKAILIAFIIVFGFRYLFYAIKWSINTLKE